MASKNYKEEHWQKYKCPICSDFFNNPILTRCGHDFCNECIITWLKNNKSCKVCQKEIDPNGDIFADKKMERIVSQLILPCPNAEHGCLKELSPYERLDHLKNCYYNISKNSDERFLCNFSNFGCKKEFTEEKELEKHLKESAQEHLNTLLEENKNIQEQLNKIKSEYASLKMVKDEEGRSKNFKIVELETQLKEKLQLIQNNKPLEDKLNGFLLLYIQLQDNQNGRLIWVIDDIYGKMAQIENHCYSPDFFTSPKSYKFQLHMQITKDYPDHIGFFVKLMRTENDDHLQWPCNALKYIVKIFHQDMVESQHFSRAILDIPESHLVRPTTSTNAGIGFPEFISKENLKNFIIDNKLIIQTNIIMK